MLFHLFIFIFILQSIVRFTQHITIVYHAAFRASQSVRIQYGIVPSDLLINVSVNTATLEVNTSFDPHVWSIINSDCGTSLAVSRLYLAARNIGHLNLINTRTFILYLLIFCELFQGGHALPPLY